ncbi:MAG: hypothetical protein DCF31_01290 [Alphaproteobacteria bacterium]|nr:MAG: hypothetical protein DCF31_01290 [Alphaproteobacteria bacterium]
MIRQAYTIARAAALPAIALTLSTLTLSALAATAAQAAYFVRPVLQYNGERVDGIIQNGTTQASQTFNDGYQALEAHVDLADGTIKTYLEMNGPGSGFGIATGTMGDRIRFTGETGTPVRFSFDFDGVITAAQETLGGASASGSRYIGIQAFFAVFDAASGATYNNWTRFDPKGSEALLNNDVSLTFNYDDPAFTEFVFNSDLGGWLDLVSGNSYDVFAAFNLIAQPGDDVGPVTMNFLNTGTIGIDAPAGASFTSQSGVFLGFSQTPGVPEPGSWALLIIGFGSIGALARRRRVEVAA